MALIQCTECNKEVSDTATKCPHCGFSLKKSEGSGCLKGLGMIILIPIGLFVLLFGFFLVKEAVSPTDLSESPTWAIDKGKESLEANLKDPGSVEYGEVWVGRLKAKPEDKGTLVACGYFNARNSFGGMVGMKRFVAGPGGPVLTDELQSGEFMETVWQETCVKNRVQ